MVGGWRWHSDEEGQGELRVVSSASAGCLHVQVQVSDWTCGEEICLMTNYYENFSKNTSSRSNNNDDSNDNDNNDDDNNDNNNQYQ